MPSRNRVLLQDMFNRMVIAKDIDQIERFYDKDFVLYTNGETQDFDSFRAGHERVYPTDISYAVRYDDESWVETDEAVAGRLWISIEQAQQPTIEYEIVLIAHFRDDKIIRLWETTWPDWRDAKTFSEYHSGRIAASGH
jgi:hypothetical protein